MSLDDISYIENLPFDARDRMLILLVHEGAKPACSMRADYKSSNDPISFFSVSEEAEMNERLGSIGLASACGEHSMKTVKGDLMFKTLYVGHDKNCLDALLSASTVSEYGKAFGFPETAIEVLDGKRGRHSHYYSDVPFEITRFAGYVTSDDNWREELKTAQKWHDVTKTVSPKIYDEFMRW